MQKQKSAFGKAGNVKESLGAFLILMEVENYRLVPCPTRERRHRILIMLMGLCLLTLNS